MPLHESVAYQDWHQSDSSTAGFLIKEPISFISGTVQVLSLTGCGQRRAGWFVVNSPRTIQRAKSATRCSVAEATEQLHVY